MPREHRQRGRCRQHHKGGPNTEAAKAFVDWVLSEEAAMINAEQSNRLSVLKGVPPVPGAPTIEQVTLLITIEAGLQISRTGW